MPARPCICLYQVLLIAIPQLNKVQFKQALIDAWLERLNTIVYHVENALSKYDRKIFVKLFLDFIATIKTPASEFKYRHHGYSAIATRNGDYHECLSSGQTILKVFEIMNKSQLAAFNIVKPNIKELTRSGRPPSSILVALHSREGIKLSIERLLGSGWLTDELIDYYLELIQDQRPIVSVLPTYFKAATKGAFKAFKEKFEGLQKKELILAPINCSNNHWFLLSLSMKKKTIEMYDSLPSTSDGRYALALKEVAIFLKPILDISNWKLELPKQRCPRQTNSNDCGVFVLAFAEYLSRKASLNFKQTHVNNFRILIFWQVLKGQVEPLTEDQIDEHTFILECDKAKKEFEYQHERVQKNTRKSISHSCESPEIIEAELSSQSSQQQQAAGTSSLQQQQQQAGTSFADLVSQDYEGTDRHTAHAVDEDVQTETLENRRVQIIRSYQLKSQADLTKVLEPIKQGKNQGGLSKTEPQNPDFNLTLIAIDEVKFRNRIWFHSKFVKDGKEVEDWLDLSVVAKVKPREIFVDFMSKLYLFEKKTYTSIVKRAKKLDEKKGGHELESILDIKKLIPDEYRDAKDRAKYQAEREAIRNFRAKKQALSKDSMAKRLRDLEDTAEPKND